jgi:hypothetical protein
LNPYSIALNSEELQEVTGYKTARKQIDALALMEIPFKVRPDGTPFVVRSALESQQPVSALELPEPVLTVI